MRLKLLFIMCIGFLLSACTKELDVNTIRAEALSNIQKLDSVGVDIKSHIDLNNYNIDIYKLKSDIIYSDDKSYTSSYHTEMFDDKSKSVYESYLSAKDDSFFVYTKLNNKWSSKIQQQKSLDALSILIQMLLSSDSQSYWKSMGYVDFNGIKCYRISRKLDEAMSEVIVLDLKSMLNDDSKLLDINYPELNLDVYVDAKTLYPIKYSVTGNDFDIQISLRDFNTVTISDTSVPNDIVNTAIGVDGSQNTEDKQSVNQTEIEYGISLDNVFLGFMNTSDYDVSVDDIAHIIEAKSKSKFIRAFLVKDRPAHDAVTINLGFDKSILSDQESSPDVNIKDSYISDVQTTTIGDYSVYYYKFEYTNDDTDILTQTYNYYIDLGGNIYANIVMNQDDIKENKLTDDVAFTLLSDFIFTN